ncbi:hypothetical protein CHELA1G11_20426 [Hyphomicrobiales bacterium]|nr:hypothetical protein CHELA1G11_20426 [Hyphomicrobiales bacterium]CAH1690155.1 hypothetical protein CHELA1G2_20739 [Hyphomicrobiales bacterium]
MAVPLLEAMAPAKRLLADRAYDADRLRSWLADRRIEAVIPGRATRSTAYPLNRSADRRRIVIERMFGKLKNWKRIATRYDRLAANFLAAIAFVALATQWLKCVPYLGSNQISELRRSDFPASPRMWITGMSGWRCFGCRMKRGERSNHTCQGTSRERGESMIGGSSPASCMC